MAQNTTFSAPLAATEATEIRFAESDPVVLTVYFLVFGFWTAAAGNDFISPTWRSVRETRWKGKLHVAFVLIPISYICVYMYFQHKNKDYKEMGAALLALAFAVLHLLRTFMGLWQLHMFKQWAISSIKSMESLGFKTTGPPNRPPNAGDEAYESDSDDDEHGGSTRDCRQGLWFFFQLAHSLTIKDRIEKIADDVLVNETLIDNRLSDAHTVCNLCLLSREETRTVKRAKSLFNRLWLRFRFSFLNALRVIPILVSLAFLEFPHFPNVKSGPRLVPRRPESVWLSWAAALVAQAGWMVDEFAHTKPNPSGEYEEHRNHFAEQILLSSALHTRRTKSTRTSTKAGCSTNTSPVLDGSLISEPLAYQDWHKYPKLCSGQFCKQEFLKRACKTGNGLPYYVQHSNVVERADGARRYGYANFESELR